MSLASRPPPVVVDQLLLAGHVLQAQECGRMHMHPADYREISIWASNQFACLDTRMLCSLHRRVPGPLQNIVENLLHARGESAWTPDAWVQPVAEAVWKALLKKL